MFPPNLKKIHPIFPEFWISKTHFGWELKQMRQWASARPGQWCVDSAGAGRHLAANLPPLRRCRTRTTRSTHQCSRSRKETQKFLAFVTNFRFLRIIALTTMPGFGTSFATCDMLPSDWWLVVCEGQYPPPWLQPEVRALNSSVSTQPRYFWLDSNNVNLARLLSQPSPAQHHTSQRKCYKNKKSFSILIC